jgi:ribosomal protein S12 methylthiotransferase accessory factor
MTEVLAEYDPRLVDPVFGVVHDVRRVEPTVLVPSSFHCYTAQCTDLRLFEPAWRVDRIGTGCSFSPRSAIAQAVGEAIERYSGNIFDDMQPPKSVADVQASGVPYLDPTDVPFFSSTQRRRLESLFKAPSPDDQVHWYTARSYDTNSAVVDTLVPYELTHLKYQPSRFGIQRQRFFPMLYAGIAAHVTHEQAFESALQEVLERHHTYMWWYGTRPAWQSNGLSFPSSDSVLEELSKAYLVNFFVLAQHAFGVVVGCSLETRATGDLLVGFSSKRTYAEAAPKALCEALQLHEFLANLKRPDSWIWKAWEKGLISKSSLHAGSAVSDEEAILDSLMHNLQYYIAQSSFEKARRHLQSLVRPDAPDLVTIDLPRVLTPEYAASRGHTLLVADLTSSDIRRLGYCVLRVFSPDLVTNTAHDLLQDAHPAWQGRRLESLLSAPPLPHA